MDLYEALAGSIGSEDDYLARNPYFLAGAGLAKSQLPAPTSSNAAFWGPIAQGISSGLMMGYGRGQAYDEAYQTARANPLLQSLSGRPAGAEFGPLTEDQSLTAALHDYSALERPKGWTPKIGQNDALLQALSQQQEYQRGIEELKQIVEMQKAELPYGPKAIEADRQKEQNKLKVQTDSLGYNPKQEEEVDKLRKEFSALPETKNFSIVEKTAKIIDRAIKDPSAVSDQELTRYSILLIEPGMAVREGEQAAIANSASIPQEWKGALDKALTGGTKLGPEVREGMKRLAMRAYEGHKEQYDRTFTFFSGEAEKRGINPNRISYIGESSPLEKIFSGIAASTITPEQAAAELARRRAVEVSKMKALGVIP